MFKLAEHGSTVGQELIAGFVSFVTGVYIVVANGAILADAGVPAEAAAVATALASAVGSLLMGLWANSPLLVIPGMGLNALFTYTLVYGLGLSWQEALGGVVLTGVIFVLLALTPLAALVTRSIPDSLKKAISPGVGLFIAFIGLQKGGLVGPGATTLVSLGSLNSPAVLLSLAGLVLVFILYVRRVPASLLLSLAIVTGLAALFGQLPPATGQAAGLASYRPLFVAFSFAQASSFAFWLATFSMTMVVVFENLGLTLGLLPNKAKFERSLQATAFSVLAAGLLGCTPTVAAGEGAAGIAAGGRTGLTAVVAGLLFLATLVLLPFVGRIPDSAVAPILVLIGVLMAAELGEIDWGDLTEAIPAFLVVSFIPLTFSIADGLAFGFLAYPLVKLAAGRLQEVKPLMYLLAALFLLYLVGLA